MDCLFCCPFFFFSQWSHRGLPFQLSQVVFPSRALPATWSTLHFIAINWSTLLVTLF